MDDHLDCVVIGAGPAGLQMGAHLQADGGRFVILESGGQVGNFFASYPRSRRLISFNKRNSISADPEIALRWDWNSLLGEERFLPFAEYSSMLYPTADEMTRYLADYSKLLDLPVQLDARVTRVSRTKDGTFLVATADRVYRSRYLVVATGVSRPHVPPIPGIELAEGYETVPFTPETFENQRVLVLGKGNSGLEVADQAVETASLVHFASPTPVRFASRSHHPGHLRLHHGRLFDMYQMKMLNSILDCGVERIDREDGEFRVTVSYSHAESERDVLCYDRVVRCTGFGFDASIFDDDCTPRLCREGRLPMQTATYESVNVTGLYFAGTLMQERDFKLAGSAFIDGFRYNVRTLHRLLQQRYHGRDYPRETVAGDPASLADWAMRRASTTSALWLQFQHLCDVITLDERTGLAQVHRELPLQGVTASFADVPHYYTMHFQWGSWDGDPFAVDRHPKHEEAHRGVFLHPVVRKCAGPDVVAEHHLLEDLVGTYHPDYAGGTIQSHNGVPARTYHDRQHVRPLRAFLEDNRARAARG